MGKDNKGKGKEAQSIQAVEGEEQSLSEDDIVGMIERLNQKTVSLTTQTHGKWRVGYDSLYRVHDSEGIREKLMQISREC